VILIDLKARHIAVFISLPVGRSTFQ
jgi:hypothetical protein